MDVAKLQSLWDEYLAAKARAEKTSDLQDGIKAGQAWGAFVRAFTTDAPKGPATVLPFRSSP